MIIVASLSEYSFMPHGHCYFWNPLVLWLNVVSDTIIALAYFSIPVALFQVVKRRTDLVFHWMFVLFAVFILACGATHVMDVWNVWHGHYVAAGAIKLVTAVASIITAFLLWPLIPRILTIPSIRQLEELNKKLQAEVKERSDVQSQIVALNANLESRVIEATREFRELADAMPQIVWAARPDGFTDYYNKRWYDFTGLPAGSVDQSSLKEILHPEDLQRMIDTWSAAVNNGTPYEIEYRFRDRASGQYKWFLGRALPVRDDRGNIIRWFGSSTDIDVHKRLEEDRARALVQERLVRSELERASRMKDEFLATLSHELRTPLNAILGWVQLIRRGVMNPTQVDQALDTVERSAKAQAQIIEDLLDMNRIVSGKIRLDVQRFELRMVIESALDTLYPTASAKGIKIERALGDESMMMSGDPSRVQQIVWNLVSNALKFTPQGGTVKVSLMRSEGQVEISISDSGQGIKAEFLPYVFDKFIQADSSITRRVGGLGLGLSLVKSLVELHGGTVQAFSQGEGKGSRFVVILPEASISSRPGTELITRDRVANALPAAQPGAFQGKRFLAVDDQADSRELVKVALEGYGALVTTADSADRALALLGQYDYDIVISDIGMPDKDGFQFMEELRKHPIKPGKSVPALALTAFARSEDRALALKSGYQMHLAKPIEPAELAAAVAHLLDA